MNTLHLGKQKIITIYSNINIPCDTLKLEIRKHNMVYYNTVNTI